MDEPEKYTTAAMAYYDKLIDFATTFGPKLLGAIIVLLFGLWIIRIITKSISKLMDKGKLDNSLKPFLKSLTSILLKTLLIISVMGIVGIEMTSFIAILGAAGLAVGMALSGTLQNFAGGVMLLTFKPYVVGDFIEAQGYSGTVDQIQIFNTIMKTPDNKTIIIPNSGISSGSLINYSTQKERRVDWKFGIAYGEDIDKAKEVLLSLIKEDARILTDPAPFVALGELVDSSVNLVVRGWVKAGDYWDVFFLMNEKVYKRFYAEGINIPFPQMDVHVHNTNK